MRTRSLTAVALLLAAACSRSSGDAEGKQRLFSHEAAPARAVDAPFDWAHPERALAMGADEAARRLGGLDFTAAVDWTVSREGGDVPAQVHVAEHHGVRQAASGAFEATSEIDPGEGPGSRAGRRVRWVDGMTYARSDPAPSGHWRERPTDHGRDARRYRDESFTLLGELAGLLGPGLRLAPAGDATVRDRPAKRFTLALVPEAAPAPAAKDDRRFGQGGPDQDTKRRFAFLEGRVPIAAEGELLADAETGVPLQVHLRSTFGMRDDPRVRVQVELHSEIHAVGGAVAAIARPDDALPDERKPPGVSDALEAAGLKARGATSGAAEPADEGE